MLRVDFDAGHADVLSVQTMNCSPEIVQDSRKCCHTRSQTDKRYIGTIRNFEKSLSPCTVHKYGDI